MSQRKTSEMKLSEALDAAVTVSIGVASRTVRRKNKRGRLWYLVLVCGKLFMVRQGRRGFKEVTPQFAAKWDDWEPQSPDEAARETALMDTPGGRGFRNTILGLALGPLPENMKVPDGVPADF
jgi:hypothetical protein